MQVDQSKLTVNKKGPFTPIEAGPPKLDIPAPLQQEQQQELGPMVQMGGGLPDLPARPAAPVRQTSAAASASGFGSISQRVPNVKQAIDPQFIIPSGSDLGAVGKIGVYQMEHTSSAPNVHANTLFYIIFIFVTFILIKRR
ncbi:hypothetical protein INT48_001233 [Thamnidium elegans]|uniref:Uncharacterized protein n=1 Tax=Thamnidium elegans TaxID=101142 RepID=A0A8H7VP36_9FUNG|nr:hypothetical protein INT48_001233 [Thamnidium elegans]